MVFSFLTAEPQAALDKNNKSSNGANSLALYGGSRGILQGYALVNAFDSNYSTETVTTVSAILGITESLALYHYATKRKLTVGQAEIIGTYGDTFLLWGSGFAQYNSKHHFHFSSNTEMMLGGNVLGMIAGAYIGKTGLYTLGDSYIIRGSSFLGGSVGAAIALQLNMDLYKGTLLSVLCSSIGLYGGDMFARNYDFNTKEGIITNFGMVAGALVGGSIGALTMTLDSVGIFPALTVLGGGIGFFTVANYYKNKSTKENPTAYNIKLNINPIGAMTLLQNSNEIETSLLNLRVKF